MKTPTARIKRFDVDRLSERAGTWTLIRGENVAVNPSPYDIPEAIVVTDDKGAGSRLVEMKYIADEDLDRFISLTKGVVLLVGGTSKRFYGAVIDTRAFRHRTEYVEAIQAALNEIAKQYSSRLANYEVARLALQDAEPLIEGGTNTGEFIALGSP